MKTDARVRYTQMMIRNSFKELLKEKPVARITVKEICERSEINRATFYHYYKDPYDLLEQIEKEMLDNLADVLSKENFHDMEAFYGKILDAMKKHGEWYISICSAHGDTAFPTRIFMACYRTAFPLFANPMTQLKESEQKLVYHFLTQGCSGTMGYWFKGGMEESIEKISCFLAEASKGIIDHFSGKY